MKTKKLTLMAMLLAIALIIFTLEAQLPPVVPIPGVKIGLANIIVAKCYYDILCEIIVEALNRTKIFNRYSHTLILSH